MRRALTSDMIANAKALCVKAVAEGNTHLNAAACAGIAQQTFYRWRDKDREFRERLEKATAEAQALCVKLIRSAAKQGNWQASAWLLERRHPEEWGRHDRVDLTNQATLNVTRTVIVITDDMQKPALPISIDQPNESDSTEDGTS